ncbi:MAG: ASPIC/UnbV domain-containing protein [Myxococcota bacterium]
MASRHEGRSSARAFAERQAELFAEGFSFSGHERDLVMLNLGERGFLDISGVSGADSVTDGRGSLFADFDNDGDLDIFLRAMHGPAHLLFRNNVGQERRWLRVRLRGTDSGTDAFGAVVRVRAATGIQTKLLSGGSGFLGQSDPRLVFGLGELERAESVEVTWPSGKRQDFGGAQAGETLLLVEGEAEARRVPSQRGRLPDPLSPGERIWRSLKVRPGERLPELRVRAGDRKVALAEQLAKERPVLLNFWATTCAPCRKEMPELEELHRQAGDRGLQVIGISLDGQARREQVARVLTALEISYPVFGMDPEARAALFTTPDVQIPLSLFLDEAHRLRGVFCGWSPELRRRLAELGRR